MLCLSKPQLIKGHESASYETVSGVLVYSLIFILHKHEKDLINIETLKKVRCVHDTTLKTREGDGRFNKLLAR